MIDRAQDGRLELIRQLNHWHSAVDRLGRFEELAAPAAWASVERYLSEELRGSFRRALNQLSAELTALKVRADDAAVDELPALSEELVEVRRRYLRTETALDFYADAVNSRTNPAMWTILSALDRLADESMRRLLDRLRKRTPPILTYVDKGLGASILKAGLRLWEPSIVSPAAAIKIARHNLIRPTALIHETGHQVAHILGWNEELALALRDGLAAHSDEVADVWSSWASEIAADAFAFAHTGYAAVASLHDVLAGDSRSVFRFVPGDPHPISYVRTLLGAEMCAQSFGRGPWDAAAQAWIARYRLADADRSVARLLAASMPLLPKVAAICLKAPMQAFGGRPLEYWIDPQAVRPRALAQLEQAGGRSLYHSSFWSRSDGVRILALIGLRVATEPHRVEELFDLQQAWLQRLGELPLAA